MLLLALGLGERCGVMLGVVSGSLCQLGGFDVQGREANVLEAFHFARVGSVTIW